ncbi:MAG TPA: exonuclease domain-containing protein [Usitatibacter sp.]|jgi:DNA polymerase-3 subunit epsilon|nr:exonuclease domain-containing protein [Usitatibacter sp.]
MLAPAVAFVDLETTGSAGTRDRVTEIGIVRVMDGEWVDEWSTLVNPGCSIPGEIQALTGITNAMVRDAPMFSELRREVHERLEGHLFVAHNARFDYGFLKNEFRRVEMPFSADVLCTVRLSRRLYPEAAGHGLDALIARHGLQEAFAGSEGRTGRHSALGDARALWRFVQMLYREREEGEIAAAVRRLLKVPSLPPQLPPDALENLPEGPGVYRFYGVNDLPIYIGKSVSLRERVRSHFSADHRSANDLRISGEIRRIEVEETAGELGALLREAHLVKTVLPLHNHRLRRKLDACFLRLPDLACAPEVVTNAHVDWSTRDAGAETLYGPFATKPGVKKLLEELAGEEGLCWRQLGWEKRGGPCFARQVRKCRGACIGEESPMQHNLRLATALAPWKLADWPWPGQRVMVRERHPDGRFEEAHVFDRWCHVGTARSAEELEDLAHARVEIGFDPDIYSLLRGYLPKHARSVLPLPQSNPSDC